MSQVEIEIVTRKTLTLKPCPFCAEETTLNVVQESSPYVDCMSCHASGPIGDSVQEAVEAWNTRKRKTMVAGATE